MYIGWYMKTNLITALPETSVLKARDLMSQNRISHLPVADKEGRLVGIVTDRNLKEAWASPATTLSAHELTYVLQKLTVSSIMVKKTITATPDMTIERGARIIHENKIGALPVLKGEKLVGIITITDLMEVLLTALGLTDDSRRLSILVKDRIGVLADVGKLMAESNINIRSMITVPLKGHEGAWQLMLRFNEDSFARAAQILESDGYTVITKYVEDITPYLTNLQ